MISENKSVEQASYTYQSITQEEHDLFIQENATKAVEKNIYTTINNVKGPDISLDDRCNVYVKENFAITMAYLSVGLVSSILLTPLNIYLVSTLGVEPPVQNTISILQSLPWSLKLVFGFISDAFPIYGMQRKPYLTMGALLYSFSFITYALVGIDNIALLSICIFIGTLGLIQMDVMADTMCVQRSKFESEESRGQMQATFYSVRFAGGLVGAILGASLCNKDTWGWGLSYHQISFLTGLMPFCLVVPWLYCLKERFKPSPIRSKRNLSSNLEDGGDISLQTMTDSPRVHELTPLKQVGRKFSMANNAVSHTIKSQLHEIWLTVQLRSVWRPMIFVFTYNLFQVPNVAWQSYLQLSLKFPAWILGMTVILGSFMTFAGIMAYKNFFFKTSWRRIYLGTVALTTFFSLLQLILIFQWNTKYLHISNYFFSLGDDVISAYISGIQFLPVCIMYMRLCPDGAEGASYSMLTTFGNIALVCASNLGSHLSQLWDVSNAAMRRGDLDGLWKLSLLTSTLAVVPLCWLHLLPKNPEEQEQLAKSQVRSELAGVIFLVVLFGSLAWTSTSAIMRIYES